MTSPSPFPTFYADALDPLRELATGGQARVFDVPLRLPGFGYRLVYKEYNREALTDLNAAVLEHLVKQVDRLVGAGADLRERMAWPVATVLREEQLRGFLMRRVPEEFMVTLSSDPPGHRRPLEVQYLLNPDDYLARQRLAISDRWRLEFLLDVARALDLLHQKGIAVGDLSPKNLLASVTARPACFFLDCDTMQVDGSSALPQWETPEWGVPAGEELATPASDSYKLALLTLRLFARDQSTRSTHDIYRLSDAWVDLSRRGLAEDPLLRPRPAHWIPVIEAAIPRASTETAKIVLPTQRPAPAGAAFGHSANGPSTTNSTAAGTYPPGNPWQPPTKAKRSTGGLIAALVGIVALVGAGISASALGRSSNPSGQDSSSLGSAIGGQRADANTSASAATPSGYPSLTLTGQECGRIGVGAYAAAAVANGHTSCPFAMNVREKYEHSGANGAGVSIEVFSPVTQKSYTMQCGGNQPVTCTGGNDAVVYVYGGTATFSG